MNATRNGRCAALCVFATTAAVLLAACAGENSSTPSDPPTTVPESGPATLIPSEVRDGGPLEVVTSIFPPFGFFGEDGATLEGIDADTVDALAPLLGMDMQVVNVNFDNFVPGLQAERFVAGFNSITDTEERREVLDFINFNKYGSQMLTLPESDIEITDLSSLCGLSVGTEKGSAGIELVESVASDCIEEGTEPVSNQTYGTQDQALVALVSGRIDTVLAGSSGGWLAEQSDGKYIANGPLLPNLDGGFATGGLALPNDSPIYDAMLEAMQQLHADGTLERIYSEYGLEDMVIEPTPSR